MGEYLDIFLKKCRPQPFMYNLEESTGIGTRPQQQNQQQNPQPSISALTLSRRHRHRNKATTTEPTKESTTFNLSSHYPEGTCTGTRPQQHNQQRQSQGRNNRTNNDSHILQSELTLSRRNRHSNKATTTEPTTAVTSFNLSSHYPEGTGTVTRPQQQNQQRQSHPSI